MWKRWIDEDTPTVVQRSESAPRRFCVQLDLRRETDRLRIAVGESARDQEEAAITLAASIVESAIDFGVEVGIEILGFDDADLPLRNGRRHLDRILAQLASIDLDASRTPGRGQTSIPPGVPRVVVHVDRIDPKVGDDSTWHLLPSSLEELRAMGMSGVRPSSLETAS